MKIKELICHLPPVVNSIYRGFRHRVADGGTILALKIQGHLKINHSNIIRIRPNGEVIVNGTRIESSYGTRDLQRLFTPESIERREIILLLEPQASGRDIANFIQGLNRGIPKIIKDALFGKGIIFVKDYKLLPILKSAGLTVIKVSPPLELSNEQIKIIDDFFRKNPLLFNDYPNLTPTQRAVILKLISNKLANGLFNFWKVMSPQEKQDMLDDLCRIDVDQVSKLIETHKNFINSDGKDKSSNVAQLLGKISLPNLSEITQLSQLNDEEKKKLAEIGETYIKSGSLGVIVMAAGAAARFGRGPKGLIDIDTGQPAKKRGRSFLSVAGEDVRKASEKYEKDIPLFVMVSLENGDEIRRHFHDNNYFGLKSDQVRFFYQDKVLPKIYRDGNLALSGVTSSEKRRIDFAPTGHGYLAEAFKRDLYKLCQEKGIKTLLIKNIDNLGATVRDESYAEVLGHHLISEKAVTVELVSPKTIKVKGVTKLLDRGGGVMSLNGRNVLIEQLAMPPEFEDNVAGNPFNTLTLTIEVEAFASIDRGKMPWYIVHKDATVANLTYRKYQFEQLLGDITHFLSTNYIIIERTGKKGRFLPVKLPKDLAEARANFDEMEKLKG